MAQSVKHLALDFGSGHDLTVPEIETHVGLRDAWDSPSLPAPPQLVPSLSLSQNKQIKIKK